MRAFAALGFLLAACAGFDSTGLRPGVSTADDVLRAMGPAQLEMENPDGSRQLAYRRGYFSNQTFMMRVGRNGILEDARNVLDEDHFYKVVPGLTRDDVLRLIGPPVETMELPRLQQIAWDYRYQDAWGYNAIFSVMFDRDWRVVGKTTRRLERDRPSR